MIFLLSVSRLSTSDERQRGCRADGADELPLRFVTAASLFDGHDAAINVMRRLIQDSGAEVVHLGHNRSVRDVVRAAIQEDADGIAISSYQGGHTEYFSTRSRCWPRRAPPTSASSAAAAGRSRRPRSPTSRTPGSSGSTTPTTACTLGLVGMIDDLVERARAEQRRLDRRPRRARIDDLGVARMLSALEDGVLADATSSGCAPSGRWRGAGVPVIGVTGTGGAGKCTVTDELLSRFVQHLPDLRIAVLAVDPTRRRTGGALLGDRIRMNSLRNEQLYMRSMATRRQNLSTSAVLADAVAFLRAAGFDLVIVETAGIGQSDSEIVDLVDLPIYVMTSEFGAASQLEKIDMLDLAEIVVINKFDKQGAADALRDVRKQWRRNRAAFDLAEDEVPVYPTIASQFDDPGVTWMFVNLCRGWRSAPAARPSAWDPALRPGRPRAARQHPDPRRARPLPRRDRRAGARDQRRRRAPRGASRRSAQHLYEALRVAARRGAARAARGLRRAELGDGEALRSRAYNEALAPSARASACFAAGTRGSRASPPRASATRSAAGRSPAPTTASRSSHQQIPKIAPPRLDGWGDRLRFLMKENLPGSYPYTGGVFPYRRAGEDPTRMFAGEGSPERTNRRFHYLSQGQPAARLSTAFDSVTLYGEDPDERPDIYGKVGNSGRLDRDPRRREEALLGLRPLRADDLGLDDDQRPGADHPRLLHERRGRPAGRTAPEGERRAGRRPSASSTRSSPASRAGPSTAASCRRATTASASGCSASPAPTSSTPRPTRGSRTETLRKVRGTVQADILKEDQAQNTCIFSTEFALKMMGDVQEFFVANEVRNFYSVSISGYHIAEAGANPISQLAFTLANGFTIVEYYLARGMEIDAFAPNLSFFFSNGMDPEYAVIGRVARRIWARAMRERYGASERSQMLKYHIQTSGRACTRRRSASTTSAPRCRRSTRSSTTQQPPHQRLRRGDHDADRGVGAPRGRDPADHQPRARPQLHREPVAGLVRDRGADRPGRGRRLRGVRADLRARRRARRDGHDVPAREDPGRVDVLRAAQARRHAAADRRQHLPARGRGRASRTTRSS